MIDLKQIESFYPVNMRPFKASLLREYFQHKILEIIYDSRWAGKLAFMGGTSLRIVHALNRFSEDLDFDNLGLKKKDFEDLAKLIEKKLRLEGYDLEIKLVFKKAYHIYVRIADMLHKTGLSGHKQAKIMISIDAEPQNFSYVPEQVLINKFDIFLKINVVPIDILLSQKISAIFGRERLMGRDFYDVVFLSGRVQPNMDYLRKKYGIQTGEELKEKLLARCQGVDFKQLAKDVENLLIAPEEVKKIIHFQEYIEGHDFK